MPYEAINAAGLVIPTVIEQSARGDRGFDLFSRLLRDRIILVNGPVEENMASLVVAELLFLNSESTEREIQMYINSPGGVITAGLAIYDTMRAMSAPIATFCVGMAASFGTILLMAGDPGRRYALPHSRIHLHQPLIMGNGITGQATDIDIQAREMLQTRDTINNIVQLHTGQSLERIRHDTDRDFYMSPEEAQEYGLIDEVLKLQDWKGRTAIAKGA
ncbi:MAG TPA: ATP-dependent Clp protease proteolytic subunit [Ktedonobacterales bacterium]|nr:ATP-dependent Clp protease proteolytic subunit [Ktedonobacterales bacterium]